MDGWHGLDASGGGRKEVVDTWVLWMDAVVRWKKEVPI
jgi:hypothetical protein